MVYQFNNDLEVEWEIIRSSDRLIPAIRELMDQSSFAWDVEGTGLRPWTGSQIIGHAFAHRRSSGQIRAVYFPCRHSSLGINLFEDKTQFAPEFLNRELQPLLANSAEKIGHNLSFDVHMAYQDGIKVSGSVFETLTGAKLVDENQKSYKLPQVLARMEIPHQIGWKSLIRSELEKAARVCRLNYKDYVAAHGYEHVTIETLGNYACQDAVYELRLGEALRPYQLQWADIWEMEMRLFWVCVRMAWKGVPINPDVLHVLEKREQARMAELAPQIYGIAGESFEITNDNEIRRILFHKLGFPEKGTTKKEKKLRVDDDVLHELFQEGHEIAGLIRQYNSSDKIVSTYTNGITKYADRYNIIHVRIDPSLAKTGRTGSAEPNLQNIPVRTALGREVRKAFIARPGMIRYCVDYSQIELRILAHLSQDPIMLKVYYNDLDIHKATALEVFGTAEKVGGIDLRRVAKILNFGIPFGIQEFGVQRNINKDLPAGIAPFNKERAAAALDGFYNKYRGVDRFRRDLWCRVSQNGGLFYNMFGRPRRVPEILSFNQYLRESAKRRITSSMVQGSAADLVKFSMVAVDEYLQAQKACEADMVLMVHDDLQFDMAPTGSAKVIRECVRIMEQTVQHKVSVPIKVDIEYFIDNWSNKKKLQLSRN
jgi:DNA polymerase-1